MCDFKQLLMLKPVLGHLDFTSCSLTRDGIEAKKTLSAITVINSILDIKTLGSYFNQYLTKLKKLTLHSNPKIGDEGKEDFFQAFSLSRFY